jgi:nucleotide-binding universal stress UspA family protein
MKKIIAAIDAMHFSEEQIESYVYIAKEAQGKLTVVLLENLVGQTTPIASVSTFQYEQMIRESLEELDRLRKENIDRVYRACNAYSDDIHIQEAVGTPVQEVIAASRFADLLLINNNTSFAFLYETNPRQFVKDVLAQAQCPVMVLPDKIAHLRELVFSYNGTFSSMYAIRQFTQLFPGFSDMPVNVVFVAEEGRNTLPHENLLKDYMEHHYDEVKYTVLNGEPVPEFLALLIHRNDCLVTYGAYGRSRLSRFFHRSDADSILRTTDIPVFITHP